MGVRHTLAYAPHTCPPSCHTLVTHTPARFRCWSATSTPAPPPAPQMSGASRSKGGRSLLQNKFGRALIPGKVGSGFRAHPQTLWPCADPGPAESRARARAGLVQGWKP